MFSARMLSSMFLSITGFIMRFSFRTFVSTSALLAITITLIGCGSGQQTVSTYDAAKRAALDTVQAGRFDGGRMWTFEYPPMDYFNEAYNFKPDRGWLDDVRMSALRFASYCSSSFVSEDGLVMTNHHCARESVEGVSKEGEHLTEKGFWAPTMDDERKVPGLFVDQLVEIRDVTNEVIAAMEGAKTDEEKLKARSDVIKSIEEKAGEETKLRPDVISLYDGGKYSLYLYKRYNDVRLVFAPELQMGYFGGDYDNFTYPRYNLDFSFFRVYNEEGKPLKTDHFFKWSKAGAGEGELVFVVGNPGNTSRLNTSAQLEFNRDIQYPYISMLLDNRVEVLRAYAKLHPEKSEEMINQIFGISNSQKAYAGQLAGLRNDNLMQRRRDFDKKFRAAVEAKSALRAKYGHVWDELADSRAKVRSVAPALFGLRSGGFGTSEYFAKAARFAEFAIEMKKSEADRAKAYQGKALDLTKRSLAKFSPVDPDMEILTLTKQLEVMKYWLGANDPIVKFAFGGQPADKAAQMMIRSTIFSDSVKLAAFVESAPESIENSTDPFIQLARMTVPRYKAASEVSSEFRTRDQVNQSLLGRALFDVYSTSIPPDATFTLRLADGIVKGFEYNGTKAPSHTTFFGMYDRNASFKGEKDWELPEKWMNLPAGFDLSTPLNFVSTNDIIGGNSGSPMINKNKEIVGLIFDGNIESLPGDYIFAEDANNRTVSVHSAGIEASLRHVYKAVRLANELVQGRISN